MEVCSFNNNFVLFFYLIASCLFIIGLALSLNLINMPCFIYNKLEGIGLARR